MYANNDLPKDRKDELIKGLTQLPKDLPLTPLQGNKAPYRPSWQHEAPLDRAEIQKAIQHGELVTYTKKDGSTYQKRQFPQGYGIRTGSISNGILAVDLDGRSAEDKIAELSGGAGLPKTVGFTSGRPGRSQHLFKIPQEYWSAIKTTKIKTGATGDDGKPEQLEFRWDGCQSVLPPSVHPITGGHRYLEGCAFSECEIASAPFWMIELMLGEPAQSQAPLPTPTAAVIDYRRESEPKWTDTDWAVSYLNALSPSRADDYDDWLTVGMALHSVSDSLLTDWDAWSRQSSKYKPGICDQKWKSFKSSGVSIGSLAHMAKQDGWRSPFERSSEPSLPTGDLASKLHPDTIEKVKQRADIVDIIGEHVVLTKRGKDFVSLCPFHDEKTPSFSVSPTKQTYECFGCGAAGNAIKFLMQMGKHSFSDVVLDLARRYDVQAHSTDGSPITLATTPLNFQKRSSGNGGFDSGSGGSKGDRITLKKLSLEDAAEQAKIILQAKHTELIENIELEKVREAFGMASYDWERKIIKPLKRDLNAERFKFDLLNLLAIDDPIERIRQQALIAPLYQMSAGTISRALELIIQQTSTPETQWFGLDEFFDLESEGLQWVIPELLPAGETIILAAAPKTGKTLLVIDAAFAVATGESAFLKETVTQGRVLIVSVDESAHSTKAKLLKRGFRRTDANNVQIMTKFDIRQIRTLEERLETFRPTLVIIDSLKRITHGQVFSENSAEFADNIYTLKETLNRYGAAGILIHHTNKNSEAMGVNKLRGSSAIAGAVWGTWQLDHIPKPDPNNKKKLIIDPKDPRRILSVFARDTEGQQLRTELDLENNSWTNHGGVGDSEEWEQERKTLRVRIIDVLTRNSHLPGLSGREIIDLMGMTPESGRSVYSELNRMVGKRLLNCRPAPGDKRYNIYSLPSQPPPQDPPGGGGGGGGSDPSPPPDFSHTPPSPPPSEPVADYSDETYTQQEFPIVSKLLSNYSADSQQKGANNPPADYPNPVTEGITEIVSNPEPKEGGGGKKDGSGDDGDNDGDDWNHYPACMCSWCLLGEKIGDKPKYPYPLPEGGGMVWNDGLASDESQSDAIAPTEPQTPEAWAPTSAPALDGTERVIAPKQPQTPAAPTEFKVGDAVANSDVYMVAYSFHGTVEGVAGDDILVRWLEREGKPNECEKYHTSELRRLE